MTDQKKTAGILLGTLIGFSVGAAAALLLAPKSGKELRGEIADQYRNTSDKTQDLARRVGDKTAELAEIVKDTGGQLKDGVAAAIEGFREAQSLPERSAAATPESPDESNPDTK
jgi:gas vesicle protein